MTWAPFRTLRADIDAFSCASCWPLLRHVSNDRCDRANACTFGDRQLCAQVRRTGGKFAPDTSAANPKFARSRGRCVCELRVQSGTGIIEFLVSLDFEVRIRTRCSLVRTSE